MIRKRHKIPEIRKQRKNHFPLLVITVIFWIVLVLLVIFINPYQFGAVGLFFVLVFICFLLTSSIILTSTKRGIIYAIAFTLFIILRYAGLGHLLNMVLVVALAIVCDFLFVR